jgi:hypothetical protein
MLRWTLIVLAAVGLVGAVASMLNGFPGAFVWAVWAVICLAGLVFERVRYKAILDAPPGEGWSATAERFVDSRSGRAVTVWFQPSTGKRAYVGDGLGG